MLENEMIVELPEATSNFWKQNRRTTYGSWPFNESDKCSAERMAAAGFYVIGDSDEPDLVECFICSKQLDGWEPDDDPWLRYLLYQLRMDRVSIDRDHSDIDRKAEKQKPIKTCAGKQKTETVNYQHKSEHEKHQSSCPFVKLNKQDEKEWTVDELYDLYKKYKTKEYMDQVKKNITTMKEVTAQLMSELSK